MALVFIMRPHWQGKVILMVLYIDEKKIDHLTMRQLLNSNISISFLEPNDEIDNTAQFNDYNTSIDLAHKIQTGKMPIN